MRFAVAYFMVIILILVFGTIGNADLKSDMALYLPFDEGDGDTTADQSENGNDGILHAVEWTGDGKFGNAVQFSGVPGGWVEVPDAPSLDIEDEVTILAWVFPTEFTAEWLRIVVKTHESDIAPWMMYGIYEEGGTNGRTGFILSIGNAQMTTSEEPIPLGEWTHMAATYDGAMMKVYYNGGVVAEAAASGKLDTNDVPVSIGRNNVGNREHYIGVIDEVAIFSRALTEAEIKQAMGAPITAAVEPSGKLPITWGFVKDQY